MVDVFQENDTNGSQKLNEFISNNSRFTYFDLVVFPPRAHVYSGDVINHQPIVEILPTSTYNGDPIENYPMVEIH
jgi:hypothetical protein